MISGLGSVQLPVFMLWGPIFKRSLAFQRERLTILSLIGSHNLKACARNMDGEAMKRKFRVIKHRTGAPPWQHANRATDHPMKRSCRHKKAKCLVCGKGALRKMLECRWRRTRYDMRPTISCAYDRKLIDQLTGRNSTTTTRSTQEAVLWMDSNDP